VLFRSANLCTTVLLVKLRHLFFSVLVAVNFI